METTSAIQAVSAKLPLFYEYNPTGWFINVEAQFTLARITSENTKFSHAVTALSPSVSEEIQHFLQTECASTNETPYSNLKNELLRVYGRRKTTKMTELLNMTSFNEKGAESTLRRMRVLATDVDTMLQCKLISMAPPSIRTAVAGRSYDSAEQLAEALDEALERDQLSLASVATPEAEDVAVCAIRQQKHSKSKFQPRYEAATPRTPKNICFYHDRFGYKAKKCTAPPCKFHTHQENAQASN